MASAHIAEPTAMALLRSALAPLRRPRAPAGTVRSVHTEKRLAELGITLPTYPAPLANYKSIMQSGNHVYLAGHIPFKEDMKTLHVGKVGKDLTTEEAAKLAEVVAIMLISTLKEHCGDLDKVKKIVKLVGFVNCTDDFTQQPEVINGCSNLIGEVFGPERGTHARSAVGTNSLPRGIPV